MVSLNRSGLLRFLVLLSLVMGLILLFPLMLVTIGRADDDGGATDPPDAKRENVGCNVKTYENSDSLMTFGAENIVVCPLTATITSSFTISSTTQSGRIFRDAIPSACDPAKAYPGIFNAGTTYNYNIHTFDNSYATSPACVTVYFDPLSGSTPCGTNAHATAYANSYDPANQGNNYLGDVGASQTQPFSFTLPAGQNLVVLVSNTSVVASCSYSFSVTNMVCQTSTDLEIIKSAPLTTNIGIPITYTLTAAHTGLGLLDATNVVISDVLPGSVNYINSMASAGSYDPVTGEWSIPTITYGTSETLNIRVKGMISGTITNTINYNSSTEPDIESLNNSATVTTTVGPMFMYFPLVMQ